MSPLEKGTSIARYARNLRPRVNVTHFAKYKMSPLPALTNFLIRPISLSRPPLSLRLVEDLLRTFEGIRRSQMLGLTLRYTVKRTSSSKCAPLYQTLVQGPEPPCLLPHSVPSLTVSHPPRAFKMCALCKSEFIVPLLL
jgi:hypothetical protein